MLEDKIQILGLEKFNEEFYNALLFRDKCFMQYKNLCRNEMMYCIADILNSAKNMYEFDYDYKIKCFTQPAIIIYDELHPKTIEFYEAFYKQTEVLK